MTSKELTIAIDSQAQKLARKAAQLIREGAPLADVVPLLDAGAAHYFYERDKFHPRSRFYTRHLIVLTYETEPFCRPTGSHTAVANGVECTVETAAIDIDQSVTADDPASRNRLEIFRHLLLRGAMGDSNNARGDFLQFILKQALWKTDSAIKQAFARVLVTERPDMLQRTILRGYDWHRSEDAYEVFLQLGGQPTWPGALRNVFTYLNCSDTGFSTKAGRTAVIRRMVAAGARLNHAEADLSDEIGWRGGQIPEDVRQLLAFAVTGQEAAPVTA